MARNGVSAGPHRILESSQNRGVAELAALMQGPIKERWEELCQRVVAEKDPKTLMNLIAEINRLLEEKERRLAAAESSKKSA